MPGRPPRWSMTSRMPASEAKRIAPAARRRRRRRSRRADDRQPARRAGVDGSHQAVDALIRQALGELDRRSRAVGVSEQHVAAVAAQAALQLRANSWCRSPPGCRRSSRRGPVEPPRRARAIGSDRPIRAPRPAREPRSRSRRAGREAHTTPRLGRAVSHAGRPLAFGRAVRHNAVNRSRDPGAANGRHDGGRTRPLVAGRRAASGDRAGQAARARRELAARPDLWAAFVATTSERVYRGSTATRYSTPG
jgi:hypothetical protein